MTAGIWDVVDKGRASPSAASKALKANRSYSIGVLFANECGGLKSPFFSAVLDSFWQAAQKQGYDITLISLGQSAMTHGKHRDVDGICVASVDFYAAEVAQLMRAKLPVITIDHSFPNHSAVFSDSVGGMELLVAHAAKLGHQRIAYVHGKQSAVTEARLTSFRHAMNQHALTVREAYLLEAEYLQPRKCYGAVRKLLTMTEAPTCILAPDDLAAFGALEAIRDAGLMVGKEISLAGYDGSELLQLARPKLCTIRQNAWEIGRRAAELLIERIQQPSVARVCNLIVPVELLPGDTLGQA
ncbi:MAG: substrate-binding domain-containing protein [Clostridia bacterium]